MFNNMKLATKLILAFLIVALIAGIIGFIGARSVNTVNDMMTDIYKNQLVPIDDIGNVREHGADNFRRLYQLTALQDQRDIDKIKEKIRDSDRLIDEGYKRYLATVLSPEEQVAVPKLDAAAEKYHQGVERFMALIEQGNQSDALTLLSGDLNVIYNEVRGHRTSLAQIMTKNADTTNTTSDGIVSNIMTQYLVDAVEVVNAPSHNAQGLSRHFSAFQKGGAQVRPVVQTSQLVFVCSAANDFVPFL